MCPADFLYDGKDLVVNAVFHTADVGLYQIVPLIRGHGAGFPLDHHIQYGGNAAFAVGRNPHRNTFVFHKECAAVDLNASHILFSSS